MSNLRIAAQQALEALEFMADEWGFTQKANRPERWQAITALRAALAEPTCATQDCMPSKCSLAAQNTEQDRVLVEMEHALNEADAIMEEVSEETADAWRKRWGYLWGRTV
jgi:hypothetical protein